MKRIRWKDLFKRTPSSVAILLGNVFVIVCALVFKWGVFPLVLLYWLENGLIGVVNVIKMVTNDSGSGPTKIWLKVIMAPFFCFHYFGFWVAHGVFVFAMFGGEGSFQSTLPSVNDVLAVVVEWGLLWALVGAIISHVFSLVYNYYYVGLYRRQTMTELMGAPYARVAVLHMFIIACGFIVQSFGEPFGAILLLTVMKTVADLVAHNVEHSEKTEEMRDRTQKAFEVMSRGRPTAEVDAFARQHPGYRRDGIAEKSLHRPMKIGCLAAILIFVGLVLVLKFAEGFLPRPIRLGILIFSIVLAFASPVYSIFRKVRCKVCHDEMEKVDTICEMEDLTGMEKAGHVMSPKESMPHEIWWACRRCKTYCFAFKKADD